MVWEHDSADLVPKRITPEPISRPGPCPAGEVIVVAAVGVAVHHIIHYLHCEAMCGNTDSIVVAKL